MKELSSALLASTNPLSLWKSIGTLSESVESRVKLVFAIVPSGMILPHLEAAGQAQVEFKRGPSAAREDDLSNVEGTSLFEDIIVVLSSFWFIAVQRLC